VRMTRLTEALFGKHLGAKLTDIAWQASSWTPNGESYTLMHTSELNNALNPYASQSRSRHSYQAPHEQAAQPAQQYTPHRSELELAISEPPPPP
jgi:hypothetical protein